MPEVWKEVTGTSQEEGKYPTGVVLPIPFWKILVKNGSFLQGSGLKVVQKSLKPPPRNLIYIYIKIYMWTSFTTHFNTTRLCLVTRSGSPWVFQRYQTHQWCTWFCRPTTGAASCLWLFVAISAPFECTQVKKKTCKIKWIQGGPTSSSCCFLFNFPRGWLPPKIMENMFTKPCK